MLRYSVSLQTAAFSLAVSCPLLLLTALGSATRFLGDAGYFLYKQSNLSLQSVAAEGGLCQSIWHFGLKDLSHGFNQANVRVFLRSLQPDAFVC